MITWGPGQESEGVVIMVGWSPGNRGERDSASSIHPIHICMPCRAVPYVHEPWSKEPRTFESKKVVVGTRDIDY